MVLTLLTVLAPAAGLAGCLAARSLGFDPAVCRTAAIEVAMQNSGLATALAIKFFTPFPAPRAHSALSAGGPPGLHPVPVGGPLLPPAPSLEPLM